MRIFKNAFLFFLVCLLGVGAGGVGARAQLSVSLPLQEPSTAETSLSYAPRSADISPFDALRDSEHALEKGDVQDSITALSYAAERGSLTALWTLAEIYNNGTGGVLDKARAFDLYLEIANRYAALNPFSENAIMVGRSFLRLGVYYRDGLPEKNITANPMQARRLLTHAATYFALSDAQFELAQLHLNTITPLERRERRGSFLHALRWLKLAARKNHVEAQATLGELLFFSAHKQEIERRAEGLFWLSKAKKIAETAASQEAPFPLPEARSYEQAALPAVNTVDLGLADDLPLPDTEAAQTTPPLASEAHASAPVVAAARSVPAAQPEHEQTMAKPRPTLDERLANVTSRATQEERSIAETMLARDAMTPYKTRTRRTRVVITPVAPRTRASDIITMPLADINASRP